MSIDPPALKKTAPQEEPKTGPAEEYNFLEALQVTEEEKAQLPQDLVLDSQKQFTSQEREGFSQTLIQMSVPKKIRLALVGNQEARSVLIRDPNKVIPLAVLRNPRLSEDEVIMYAQLRSLPEDVFSAMAKHKTWIKNYQVKLALVSNPKAPLSLALKLLDHLHDRDLQNISKSKNVSYVLARSAARLLFTRRG
jgi:hypothetical protein